MTRCKNREGFLLTEAMIATAIVGLMLIPLLAVHMRVSQRIARFSSRYDRVLRMNAFLMEARRAQEPDAIEFVLEKKIQNPESSLVYELKAVDDTSVFKGIPGLYFERVTANWREDNKRKSDVLLHIVFRPQPPKEAQ